MQIDTTRVQYKKGGREGGCNHHGPNSCVPGSHKMCHHSCHRTIEMAAALYIISQCYHLIFRKQDLT